MQLDRLEQVEADLLATGLAVEAMCLALSEASPDLREAFAKALDEGAERGESVTMQHASDRDAAIFKAVLKRIQHFRSLLYRSQG